MPVAFFPRSIAKAPRGIARRLPVCFRLLFGFPVAPGMLCRGGS